ncbi:DUF2577 family protein [Veillonella magna]|uniref:DUF2577 family protein n=1 Tax=Veillonella magna TaxID=464322 RepID=A0ABS2GIR4_9FIRM|nr:DUF2577 family protein [Veillonella magna]MBM6824783.1 DUF2577 family protein [Veillonella magna]MBM6913138.1 DUF2577 family protein [Veillonella magna]
MADANKIPAAEHSAAGIVEVMHEVAKSNVPQGTMIGIVTNPPPLLVVHCNDIDITHEQIYCNDYWLVGHDRTAKGHIISATQNRAGGGGYAEYASHNHDIHNDYTDTIIMTDTLEVGDLVSVTPITGQTEQMYLIGQKVVRL